MANTDFNKNSIDKAFDLMEYMRVSNRPVSLKEISDALDMPKSSAHGLITKLIHQNAVTQNAYTGKYSLGIRLLEFGNSYILSKGIITYAKTIMQDIANNCGKSVHLMTKKYPEVILVASAEPTNERMKLVMSVGTACPMYNNAAGRVFLTALSESQLKIYANSITYKSYTRYSCLRPEDLIKIIETTRKKGYGEDHNERNIGLHGIGFPVHDMHGNIEYALSAVGMVNRNEEEEMNLMIREIRMGARMLSKYLGYIE